MAIQPLTHKNDFRFAELGSPRRIWAVPSIHGEYERLQAIHDKLFQEIQPGDRLVYLGNMIGVAGNSHKTIEELLAFRRSILARPGIQPNDLVYLRGAQEEMLQKLMQIQFAPNPRQILTWMLENGLSHTLSSYNIDTEEGLRICGTGVIQLAKWTEHIRKTVQSCPGHDQFIAQLRRAAFTGVADSECEHPILFVNSGLDMSRPLHEQGDRFWWGRDDFQRFERPYKPFEKVIRGYDPLQRGLHLNCVTATLDNGCGYGGSLVCAMIDPTGAIAPQLEA